MMHHHLLHRLKRYYLRANYQLGNSGNYDGFHFHHCFGKKISFTFDDGPSDKTTLVISRFLKKNGIQGTFFVEGRKVLENPEVLMALDADGHVIGNHSFNHPRWENVTKEMIYEQIEKTEQAIDHALKGCYATGYPHAYFRPPYGLPWTRGGTRLTRKIVQQVLSEKKLKLTLWQIDSKDWKYSNAQTVFSHVEQRLDPVQGGIILFHDTNELLIPILEKVLNLLGRMNYEIVGLDKLSNHK